MTSPAPGRTDGRGARFQPQIQGLRALAVVLVVVFHTGYALPGGFVGVDVFFVISGYLIIGLLDREAASTGEIDLRDFFARRVRRLLPALATVTTTTLIASVAFVELGASLRATARTAAGASLFVANAVLYREADYFAPDAERNPLLHTWSLSVEEQFYLAVPVILASCIIVIRRRWGLGSRRAAWMALLLLGSAVSFIANVLLVDLGVGIAGLQEPELLAFYAPFTRAWQFGAGGILALATAERARQPDVGSGGLPLLGLGLILYAAVTFGPTTAFPGVRAVLPVTGTILLLLPSIGHEPHGSPRMLSDVLSSRAAVLVGDLSYSLYLWHWPAIVLMRAAVGGSLVTDASAVVIASLLSFLTYRSIEDPIRRGTSLTDSRAVVLGVACSVVPVIISLGVLFANERVASDFEIALADRSWSRTPCYLTDRSLQAEWPVDECTRGRADTGSPFVDVLLLGDSHADSLSEGVLAATETLGLSLGVWAIGGQPPHGDAAWVDRFASLIEATRPSVVILATRSPNDFYFDEQFQDRWLPVPRAGGLHSGLESAWISSVASAVERYRTLGPTIVWVQGVPEFPSGTADRVLGPTLVFRDRGFRAITMAELELQRGEVVREQETRLAAIPGVIVLDPAEVLCSPDCSNGEGSTFFYFDPDHLTPTGSRLLGTAFKRAILDALAMAI